jgi:hypothetical protein
LDAQLSEIRGFNPGFYGIDPKIPSDDSLPPKAQDHRSTFAGQQKLSKKPRRATLSDWRVQGEDKGVSRKDAKLAKRKEISVH